MSEELKKIIEELKNDGTKSGFSKAPKVLIRAAKVLNKANKFKGREGIIEEEFQGQIILRTPKKYKKALFVIHGGGYIFTATPQHIEKGFEMGEKSERDVIFPIYPTLVEKKIEEIIDFLIKAYEETVRIYGAENIAMAGFSAGGSASLSILDCINKRGEREKMPELVIALSPSLGVETNEELDKMREMEERDIQIPVVFVENFYELIKDAPPIYKNSLLGDFSGARKMYFYFGGDEIMSLRVSALKRRIEELGIDSEIIIGKGLFHCYPLFDGAKELSSAFREIVEILK